MILVLLLEGAGVTAPVVLGKGVLHLMLKGGGIEVVYTTLLHHLSADALYMQLKIIVIYDAT